MCLLFAVFACDAAAQGLPPGRGESVRLSVTTGAMPGGVGFSYALSHR